MLPGALSVKQSEINCERVLTGVGECDLVTLIRIDPDATLSALQHSSSQSLLQSQECHDSIMLLIN